MKKILAFVLLAALLLNALPVYAANAPTFRVDTVTAEVGDTVEVTIWIDNNPVWLPQSWWLPLVLS